MIIDAHAHLDCSSDEALSAEYERYRTFLDDNEVAAALVMTKSVDHIDFFPEHERLFELAAKDERLQPIINFDAPFAGDEHVEAVETWLSTDLARAAKIYPGYDPFYPHELPRCLELYSMLDRLGKPVMIHCGDTVTANGRLKYARPLFLDDIAVAYPTLKIVMAHIGQPFYDEAAAVLYKNKNVVADGSGLFMSGSDEFVPDAFVGTLIERLRFLFAYVDSPEAIHFGGDFPFTNPAHHLEFWELLMKELEFDEQERKKLLFDNARQVFGLSESLGEG